MYLNSKLFSVFCFVIFMAALFLKLAWPQLIVTFLLLIVAGTVAEGYLTYKRSNEVAAILNEQADPELFLKELEKDEKIAKEKKLYDYHMLNRSAGLFYLGRWKEALEDLKSVDRKKLHKVYQYHYFSGMLANLLGDGQVQQAREFMEKNKEWLAAFPKKPEIIAEVWKSNCAWLDYCEGELARSRAVFEGLLQNNIPPIMKATTYYILGLIDLKESKRAQARENFAKAVELGGKTFIKDKVAQLGLEAH